MNAAALRKSRLAAIHMGKKALGMDDDTYRDVLQSAAGVQSAANATPDQLVAILRRFESLGFSQTRQREFGNKPSVTSSKKALIDKIEALLADAGRHWNYADGCAKKMFGKDKVIFCTGDELWRIVCALEADKKRRSKRNER